MSQTTQDIMTCAACGLKYPWAARLAGKKIKCKCGVTFVAPASAGGATQPGAAAAAKSPRVQAAVARLTPPPQSHRDAPASPPVPPGAKPTAAAPSAHAARPAAPARPVAPAKPAEPVIDLEDDDNEYDLADDLDAPPPLDPLPAAPVAATAPVAARQPARSGGRLPAGAPPFAGYKPKKYDDSAEKKAEVKKLIFIGVGVLLLIGVIIGLRTVMSGADSEAQYASLPGEDGRYQRLAEDDKPYEAKEWLLANNTRGVIGFEWTRDKTEKMIDRWYSEGVKKVIVFGQAPMTSSFCVELPDDPAKRKAFITYAENWRTERHQTSKDPVKDVGQKYVFLDFMIIN